MLQVMQTTLIMDEHELDLATGYCIVYAAATIHNRGVQLYVRGDRRGDPPYYRVSYAAVHPPSLQLYLPLPTAVVCT